MDADRRVAATAARHHGIVTRAQALAAGLSARQIQRRLSGGRWEALAPGVYRLAGSPRTAQQQLVVATSRARGTGSHLTAGWVHGLADQPKTPEVTVPLGRGHQLPGVRVHRTSDLRPWEQVEVDGMTVTDPTRTCIDLGARLSARRLERVIDRAVHRGLTDHDLLGARFLQLARRGRDGIAAVRQVLEWMDPSLAPAESDLETLLLRIIREAGLPLPIRQHPIRVDGRAVRIDLAYPDRLIAIESDGFAHHGGRSAFEHDRARQNLLALSGWTVLRFTWRQICDAPHLVVEQIRRALAAASQRNLADELPDR